MNGQANIQANIQTNIQTNIIEVEGLSKSFAGVPAVDRISFSVRKGEIFGLVGPDGAGKTTTMRMLAGVMSPDGGRATVVGLDIATEAETAKHKLSYMPQRFGLYEELTVAENIRFYAKIFGIDSQERDENSARLLAAAGMGEFVKRQAGKLSGGMKQKLGLICALIHTPELILLDEPTNGVDPSSRRDFWRILYSLLEKGVTILVTTAYLDEAERCQRIALLHEGRLLFCDTPARLKANLAGGVLAIVSNQARELGKFLANNELISNIVTVGDGLHLIVENPDEAIPKIERMLDTAGFSYEKLEKITPTIEDVFIEAVVKRGHSNG